MTPNHLTVFWSVQSWKFGIWPRRMVSRQMHVRNCLITHILQFIMWMLLIGNSVLFGYYFSVLIRMVWFYLFPVVSLCSTESFSSVLAMLAQRWGGCNCIWYRDWANSASSWLKELGLPVFEKVPPLMTVYIKCYTGLWSALKALCGCFPWVFLCSVLSEPDVADV